MSSRAGEDTTPVVRRTARRAAGSSALVLTGRDHELVHAVWSLGWSTATTLAGLVAPGTQSRTLRRRLGLLVAERLLRQHRFCLGRDGHVWIYEIGPRAGRLADAFRQAWRPPAIQLEHTLAVGQTLSALHRPGRFPGLRVTGWQGEAELRAWAQPGDPYPDAAVSWSADAGRGRWLVELDRATETSKTWRRKMDRYYVHSLNVGNRANLVLAVTTSRPRALRLAAVAHDVGQPLLTMTMVDLADSGDPLVYDSRTSKAELVAFSWATTAPARLCTDRQP